MPAIEGDNLEKFIEMRETTSYLNNQNRFLTKTNQDLHLKINLLTHMNKQIRWKLNIGDEDELEN